MYVLTSEVNDYSQHGEYFEAVFKEKPSLQELSNLFYNKSLEELDQHGILFIVHVFNGGGRKDKEDYWLNLKKVNDNGRISDNDLI